MLRFFPDVEDYKRRLVCLRFKRSQEALTEPVLMQTGAKAQCVRVGLILLPDASVFLSPHTFFSSYILKIGKLSFRHKILVLGQLIQSSTDSGGLRWRGSVMRGGNGASGQHMRWKGIPGNLVTHFFLIFPFNVVFGLQRSRDTWLPSRNGSHVRSEKLRTYEPESMFSIYASL